MILWYVSFSFWLTSLSMITSRTESHKTENSQTLFTKTEHSIFKMFIPLVLNSTITAWFKIQVVQKGIVKNLPPSWHANQLMLSGLHGALRDILCIFKQICVNSHLFFYLHAWPRSPPGVYIWTSRYWGHRWAKQAPSGSFCDGKWVKTKNEQDYFRKCILSDFPTKHVCRDVGVDAQFINMLILHCNLSKCVLSCLVVSDSSWPHGL